MTARIRKLVTRYEKAKAEYETAVSALGYLEFRTGLANGRYIAVAIDLADAVSAHAKRSGK